MPVISARIMNRVALTVLQARIGLYLPAEGLDSSVNQNQYYLMPCLKFPVGLVDDNFAPDSQ